VTGCVVVPCDACGQDADIRLTWAVFGQRGCSPKCARELAQVHYKRATDAMLDELNQLERRLQLHERRAD